MRLTSDEVDAIKAAAAKAFGSDTVVRLFGSRVDDARRGGDIDLHIEFARSDPARQQEVDFRADLWERLDEEPVSVVVHRRGEPLRWIDRAALRDGLIL